MSVKPYEEMTTGELQAEIDRLYRYYWGHNMHGRDCQCAAAMDLADRLENIQYTKEL